jgi:hypothetical protein
MQGSMKSLCRIPLTFLLVSTLLLAQTALPLLHVGCGHDHSAGQAKTDQAETGHKHTHGHCRHHHHQVDESVVAKPARALHSSDDCAACRFSTLSSLTVVNDNASVFEPLIDVVVSATATIVSHEPTGLYRSRAPPALS